ncbi:MAG: hypothetical protein H6Q90_7231 [Deltaproteobacteria bacterium]|nr:hypothetical protein [Deltaproteobacteria bacterium]
MSRNPLQQRLISIVEPVCEAAGFELVDLRFVLDQGGWVLRVCVDLPIADDVDITEVPADRVDLNDCENLSRELSAVLDVDDPITQPYSLEVGSPGIDRPLRTAKHFERFAGSQAKIQMAVGLPTPSGERRNFRGVLEGVERDNLLLNVDGQTYQLPIDDVESAKLVPDWDEVMRGKSGVGKTGPKPVKPGHRPSAKKQNTKPATGSHEGPAAKSPTRSGRSND